MPTPRAALEAHLQQYTNWDTPGEVREAAEALLSQLSLLHSVRRRTQHLQGQVRQMGAYVLPHIANEARDGVAEIRRLKASYTEYATKYRARYFPGLDTEIEDVPEVDFGETARADDGL